MDALSSFIYLTDHVPDWLDQLTKVTERAVEKNNEFVAEYAKVVSRIRPKRIKSPSLRSIRSSKDKSIHLSQIDPQNEQTLPPPPDPIDINPLEAGNKYLYAQAQKKRKPNSSIRSGASGLQKFRSKHQVIVYYDSLLQNDLEAMVKAVGIARNNLRKGRNALTASRGFKLPALVRRHDLSSLTPSLENIRGVDVDHTPNLGGKYSIRSSSQTPASEEEARFTEVDKMLENVQGLYETAAHQFLRDGDCKAELQSAKIQLTAVLDKAGLTVEVWKQKAKEDVKAKAKEDAEGKETDSDATLCSKPSVDNLDRTFAKLRPTPISQTIEEMKNRHMLSGPPPAATEGTPLTAGMAIEVDDDASDDGSLQDLDLSHFRMNSRLLRG